MQGNSPDEEHIDPHGECRHEIERLRAALGEIASGLSVRHPFDIANEALQPIK